MRLSKTEKTARDWVQLQKDGGIVPLMVLPLRSKYSICRQRPYADGIVPRIELLNAKLRKN